MPPAARRHPAVAARLLAFALGLLLTLSAVPAHAADLTLATNGSDPSIAVDEAGTGHLAWYAQTGSSYQVVYCRLPRGASDCSVRKVLASPGNQVAFNRSQILLTGSKVIILASYVNNVQGWVSNDGGNTWPASPIVFSKELGLNQAVVGPGGFSVNMIGGLGPKFVNAAINGANAATTPIRLYDDLPPSASPNGGGVGMLNSTTPFITYNDGGTSYVQRFNPNTSQPDKSPNNALNWFPRQLLGAEEWETVAASGPSGAFVGASAKTNHPLGYGLIVRRVREDGVVEAAQNIRAPYAPVIGTGSDSVTQPTLFEDGGGRVHAIYSLANGDNPIVYQWSKRGETWGQPIVLDPDESGARNFQIGASSDGGGWLAYDIVPGAFGQIHVIDLGAKGESDPPFPTPAPVPAGQPTPVPTVAPPACPLQVQVSPQAKAMVRSGPCFKDLGKGKFSTTGTVRLNGLDLVPSGSGATTTVDTKAHRVQTKGKVEITAGSVVLSRSPVDWDLDGLTTIPDLGGFGVSLLGFKLAGTADLSFKGNEAFIHVYVELPSPLDQVRGDSTLKTTMTDGLTLDDVHIHATGVPIGPLTIEEFDVKFSGGTNRFEGYANLVLPPGASKSIQAKFGMENGGLKHLDLEVGAGVPPLPLTLWTAPPVFLGRVGISLTNGNAGYRVFGGNPNEQGFKIAGGLKIDAGASIGGKAPISIDALPSSGNGAYVFVPTSGKYAEIGVRGALTIVDVPVASGEVQVRTDGPIQAKGSIGLDVGPIDVNAKLGAGVNLSNGDFYGEGSAAGCVSLAVIEGCGSMAGIVSSKGISLCGSAELKNPQTGLGIDGALGYSRPWGGDSSIGSCDLESYKPSSFKGSGSRAQRLDVTPFPVKLAGSSLSGIRVEGAPGSRPGFTLSGPAGRTLTVPAGLSDTLIGDRLMAVPTGDNAVDVQVRVPKGDWSVIPTEGGPAITRVLAAGERSKPKATSKVSSAGGRARKLTVRASALGGQRLLVREVLPGDGGTQELGTIKTTGTSTLRFTPVDGKGGKRTIQAVVLLGDRQVDTITLGSYTAPGPITPAAPRRVSVSRGKSGTTIKWTKVAGAASYVVSIKGSDGRRQRIVAAGKASSAKLTQVTADDRLDVRVQARSKLGRLGPARAATSKATAKVKKTTTKSSSKKK